MRAAIYARYSSDLQRDASIEDQINICRETIKARGWYEIKIYADRATSGSTRFRPAYQELLTHARERKFDIVVSEALDRLSRDQEDVASLYKTLNFAGINLFTLAEGEINELHVGLKGTMNALFIKDLAAKTHRGMKGRIEQKKSAGGLCYGYNVVREYNSKGDPIRGGREINPAEANVINWIFREFADGASPHAIARRLNNEGQAGPNGRPWQDTTIRGHAKRATGILRNELYVGRMVWNRQHWMKDPTTGNRIARPNPPEKWVIQDNPELRIVDQDLWDRTQERLGLIAASPVSTGIRESAFWTMRRPKRILSGLIYCGCCGHKMSGVGKDYIKCTRSHRVGLCDFNKSIRTNKIEELVINALQHNLMQPELVAEFVTSANEEFNRMRSEEEANRESAGRKLIKVQKEIDKLIDSLINGYRGPELQSRLDELTAEKMALKEKIEATPPPPVRLHPNLSQIYKQKVADLRNALTHEDTRTHAFEIIRGLIEKVIIRASDENGYEIELIGDIAAMVEVSISDPDRRKAHYRSVFYDKTKRSVRLDAGTGFEPVTFRL